VRELGGIGFDAMSAYRSAVLGNLGGHVLGEVWKARDDARRKVEAMVEMGGEVVRTQSEQV
jgi:hypothetical protein